MRQNFLIIVGVIIVIILLGAGGWFYFAAQQNEAQTKKADEVDIYIQIYIQAQEFVKQGLKSPATAKFPSLAIQVDDLGDKRYKVLSYVDSQNSYGALLRNDWTVIMKLSENEWILERMVIGGEVIYDPIETRIETERQNKRLNEARSELNKEINTLQKQLDEALKMGR